MELKWNRPKKNIARECALGKKDIVKCYLGLPSKECLDLKLGLKTKIFNKNTFIIAIENNKQHIPFIRSFLKRNFKNFYIHNGELHTLNLSKVLSTNQKIDFSFIDTCDNMNFNISYWIYKNREYFEKHISFTFKAVNRKKNFERIIKEWCPENLLEQLEEKIRVCPNNLSYGILNNDIKADQAAKGKESRNFVKVKTILYRTNLITSAKINCLCLLAALDNKDITFNNIYLYKDKGHSEMILVDIFLGKEKENLNDFQELIKIRDEKSAKYQRVMFYRDTKRSSIKHYTNSISYQRKFHILCKEDMNKPGKRMLITKEAQRIAKESGLSNWKLKRTQIIGGINRSLTLLAKE